jgi:hypothetical protein
MLLRRRTPRIRSGPANQTKGFEHLDDKWIAVLRWLQANKVEFVLIGPVGEAIRGDSHARGPVAIIPAPYGRNYGRIARALWAGHARLRLDRRPKAQDGSDNTLPVKMTAEKLARGPRWTFRIGVHDLDIEAQSSSTPSYQELLYEAGRFQIADDVTIEVASPEDLEHYAFLRRTGVAPEIRISRGAASTTAEADSAEVDADAQPETAQPEAARAEQPEPGRSEE